jgi:acyl-CoA thioesterase
MKIDSLEYGEACLSLKMRQELTQGTGLIHGGVISALCDTAVAMALATMIEDNESMLTLELKINFITPADGDIHSIARIIHKGRKTAVGDVEVKKEDNVLVAKGLVTYYLVKS